MQCDMTGTACEMCEPNSKGISVAPLKFSDGTTSCMESPDQLTAEYCETFDTEASNYPGGVNSESTLPRCKTCRSGPDYLLLGLLTYG